MMADAFSSIINRLAKQEAAALDIYDEIIRRYAPGGAFEQRYLGELERRKTREVGRETQQLISSGLYGTTVLGGVPRRWEEEVGGPERLKLEDIQMQRLSEAQASKAGFIAPDYGMVAQLASQIGAGGGDRVPARYDDWYERESARKQAEQAQRSAQAHEWDMARAAAHEQKLAEERARSAAQYAGRGAGGAGGAGVDTTPTERGQYGTYYGAGYRGEAAPTPAAEEPSEVTPSEAAPSKWEAYKRQYGIVSGKGVSAAARKKYYQAWQAFQQGKAPKTTKVTTGYRSYPAAM